MKKFVVEIKSYLEKEIEILNKLNLDEIDSFIEVLLETYENDGNIYIFGNGGSAATASHFANDFNKGISEYVDKKFRFMCLNDNVSTMLAIANDLSYEEVFSFQLRGRLRNNDLVIGISGSGNSKNIINAIETAKNNNIKTVGITGYDGGILAKLCDVSVNVPIKNMQITEDIHMVFDHMIMSILKDRIANNKIVY